MRFKVAGIPKHLVLALLLACLGGTPAATAGADCAIDGPSNVSVNQSFTLCGPTGSGYAFEWHGSGVRNPRTSCITVNGQVAGDYQYELITYVNGVEQDRCVHTVRVGAGATGSLQCVVSGPRSIVSGSAATLCAPASNLHSYEWSGPDGFTSTSRCITAQVAGDYDLTIRNVVTGYTRQCTHRLEVTDAQYDPGTSGQNPCAITGPRYLTPGQSARLCAGAVAGQTYRWTKPNGAMLYGRCIDATLAGTYSMTVTDQASGSVRRCSFVLESQDVGYPGGSGGSGNPDEQITINCPRSLRWWREQCPSRATAQRELTTQTLLEIARKVDERSRYFNWSNDLDGFCRALWPTSPLTYRKNLARHFAALLANVAAGEMSLNGETQAIGTQSSTDIGLDVDTRVTYRGSRTIQDLINQMDNLLLSQSGSYAEASRTLQEINLGHGIGSVCE